MYSFYLLRLHLKELGFSYYYKEYCASYGNSMILLSEIKKSQLGEFLEVQQT
jgi:hypothetical protein